MYWIIRVNGFIMHCSIDWLRTSMQIKSIVGLIHFDSLIEFEWHVFLYYLYQIIMSLLKHHSSYITEVLRIFSSAATLNVIMNFFIAFSVCPIHPNTNSKVQRQTHKSTYRLTRRYWVWLDKCAAQLLYGPVLVIISGKERCWLLIVVVHE